MGAREIATEVRLAQWSQIIQERAASGLSIEQFCKQNGVARNRYFYWQRKLREATAQQLAQPQALVPSGWATVQEAASEQNGSIILRVNGVEVEVCQGFDPELLAKVCRALSC